jgi:acyl-coenzyme A synthetase/AMP-(fatty) acid ligase
LREDLSQCPRRSSLSINCKKTRSGKIVQRVLKAKEMGIDLGEISTLEE